jgi:DNA helicase-2/ATP-dependent DNA helicase PcrA
MNLNSEQRAAVAAGAGAWRVEAGPGAGKTRVAVARFEHLRAAGISENEILSLTFTRSAAQEMRDRAGCAKPARGGFRTFHALCLAIALAEAEYLPFRMADFPIPQNGEAVRTLKKILKKFPAIFYREAKEYISRCLHRGISAQEATAQGGELAQIYFEYEQRMREQGLLDFDSLQLEVVRMLERESDVRARWQFAWVQVDEFQDTDEVQIHLVQLLSEKHGNVFVVGDVNQCLYAWRGAAPECFLEMEKYFPGVQTLYLGKNYRSTRRIVDFCRGIAPVRTGLIARLCSENEVGAAVDFIGYAGDREEAADILCRALYPEDSAVLVRTNRQLRAIEDECLNRGMRYNLLGRSGFWQRSEIEDLLAFLAIIEKPALCDAAVARVIRAPYKCSKYLGAKFLTALGKPYLSGLAHFHVPGAPGYQYDAAKKLYEFLMRMRRDALDLSKPEWVVDSILEAAGMREYFSRDADESDADNEALENLDEAVAVAARFASVGDLLAHAQRAIHAAKNRSGLTLSTVHQAKGKEWENVFVAGVTQDILPHKNGEYDEEQRIFYVACSRAARRLTITWHGQPSAFVNIAQDSGGDAVAMGAGRPIEGPPSSCAVQPVRLARQDFSFSEATLFGGL